MYKHKVILFFTLWFFPFFKSPPSRNYVLSKLLSKSTWMSSKPTVTKRAPTLRLRTLINWVLGQKRYITMAVVNFFCKNPPLGVMCAEGVSFEFFNRIQVDKSFVVLNWSVWYAPGFRVAYATYCAKLKYFIRRENFYTKEIDLLSWKKQIFNYFFLLSSNNEWVIWNSSNVSK